MKKNTLLINLFVFMLIFVFFLVGCTNVTNKETSVKESKIFKVAAVQFNSQLNKRDENINALIKVITEAAKNGAKLIVTPEMVTTGYYYKNREAIEPFVDTIPGITTQKLTEVAKEYHTYIVVGLPEVDSETGIYYNAAALIGPEGYIGKYRKMHQWETEEHWAAWGDLGVPVYDTEIGKIAINICMDSAYFESARLAAVNGADILAFPTNSSAQAISALQARAEQNGLYIVSANRSNTENGFHMIGASAVWSPAGEKLVEAKYVAKEEEDIDEPTIVYAEINPSHYENAAKERLNERRTELYQDLMLYIAPWDYTKNTTENDITAAALQYEPVIGDKEANTTIIKELINDALIKAEKEGTKLDLIVLPELALTGPVAELNEINIFAETLDGATVKTFKELAATNEVHIVFGMIEKEGDKLYDSAILVEPKGEVVGKYRKTHLNESDKSWATQGDEIKVFETDLGKIGIMIGYDALFPEVAGVMMVNRADIITIPTSWDLQYGKELQINKDISANRYPDGSMCLWDSIAMSSQAYTIVSNFTGTENNYLGGSALFTLDPLYGLDQPVVTLEKRDALVMRFSTIQADWWFNQEKLVQSRRTAFYKPLVH